MLEQIFSLVIEILKEQKKPMIVISILIIVLLIGFAIYSKVNKGFPKMVV